MTPGSHNVAAEIVARALLEGGATNLQAKLGAEIASFGDHCFVSDARMKERLVKPGGGQYHRESIGRARRLMSRAGWIESKRVFPTQIPDGAKHPTTHGTTSKRILWKTLGIRSPMTRGQQRRVRKEHDRRPPQAESEAPRTRPRVAIPPELAALLAGVAPPGDLPARRVRTTSRAERPIDRERRDVATTETKAADARRELERWERANRDRGPPE